MFLDIPFYRTGDYTNYAENESTAFRDSTTPRPSVPFHAPVGSPGNANHLVNRVVQKASFRSPEFIGFFAPISENRGGPLATGN